VGGWGGTAATAAEWGANTAGGWNLDGSAAAGGVVEVRLLLVLSSRRLLELPMRPVLASGEKKTHSRTGVLVIIDIRMVSIYSPLFTGLYRNVSFADCIYRVSTNCLRCP
jgi:hypothetical protein